MPLDARLNASLTQLLITILQQKILSPGQILSCKDAAVLPYKLAAVAKIPKPLPKGLTRPGETMACYINSMLMFLFETMRKIPSLRTPWETFVEVVKMNKDKLFVKMMCLTYHQLYNTDEPVDITRNCFKVWIDKHVFALNPDAHWDQAGAIDPEQLQKQKKAKIDSEPNYGYMMGDPMFFIQLFAKEFQDSSSNTNEAHVNLTTAWIDVFKADKLFEITQCVPSFVGEDPCKGDFITTISAPGAPKPEVEMGDYLLLQTVVHTGAHYIFFKHLPTLKLWIEYDDANIKYHYNELPYVWDVPSYTHVLNLYHLCK